MVIGLKRASRRGAVALLVFLAAAAPAALCPVPILRGDAGSVENLCHQMRRNIAPVEVRNVDLALFFLHEQMATARIWTIESQPSKFSYQLLP